MKNLKLLSAVFAFVFAFSSCSKDDDKVLTKQEMLTGKWEFSKTGYITDAGVETIGDYSHACTTQKDFYQFSAGGIFKEEYYSYNDCSLDLSTGKWSLSENKLSITFDGSVGSESYEIIELTSTTLKLKYIYSIATTATKKFASMRDNIFIFTKA